ncbi:hypothetical protein Dimus_016072 [Dionaea muscipula]
MMSCLIWIREGIMYLFGNLVLLEKPRLVNDEGRGRKRCVAFILFYYIVSKMCVLDNIISSSGGIKRFSGLSFQIWTNPYGIVDTFCFLCMEGGKPFGNFLLLLSVLFL